MKKKVKIVFLTKSCFANTAIILFISLVLAVGGVCPGAEVSNSLERILGKGAKVSISPDVVTSDSAYTFKIQIKLGAGGLSSDDSIGLVCGSYIDRWNFKFPYHYWGQVQPWQIKEPNAANFTTAKCSRSNVNLSISIGAGGPLKPFKNEPGHFGRSLRHRMRYVMEIKSNTNLKKGDIITVLWGDRSKNCPGVKAPLLATTYFFLPFKYSLLPQRDRDLPNRRGEFELMPHIRVKGKTPSQFYLTAQPLHRVKEKFSLNIAAVDEHGNLSEDFTGRASLSCNKSDIKLPAVVKFTKADKGNLKVDNINFQKPGWYKISAVGNNIKGKSNYIRITKKKPDEQIYFGDMHTHTLDCDGTIWYQSHYNYARDVAGLDFGAVSCHAAYLGCKEAWDNYKKYATANNKPGRFVTFYGYEWAGGGHINAYFLNDKDATLLSRPLPKNSQPDETPFRIFYTGEDKFIEGIKALDKRKKVILIAHCHTRYGESVDDDLLWLDEIYSFHYKYNKIREDRYRNNLAKGLYLGVVAGSDMHLVNMGYICKQPGPLWPGPDDGMNWPRYQTPGLQAAFAHKLTRNGLYEAMKKRHTYGTTGQRIVLLFDIDGENIMGDRLTVAHDRKPKFNIQVGGTDEIREVTVCKFDEKNWSEPMTKKNIETDLWIGTWQDQQFSRSAIYYIRAKQVNGSIAWSSPIWLQEKTLGKNF